MKTPLRFCLLRHLIDRPAPATAADVFEGLKSRYGHERQCRLSFVEAHLDSLRGVGIIEVVDALEEGDKLIPLYQVTDYGKSRGRYLTEKE
jgi:hypothetical protein